MVTLSFNEDENNIEQPDNPGTIAVVPKRRDRRFMVILPRAFDKFLFSTQRPFQGLFVSNNPVLFSDMVTRCGGEIEAMHETKTEAVVTDFERKYDFGQQ